MNILRFSMNFEILGKIFIILQFVNFSPKKIFDFDFQLEELKYIENRDGEDSAYISIEDHVSCSLNLPSFTKFYYSFKSDMKLTNS